MTIDQIAEREADIQRLSNIGRILIGLPVYLTSQEIYDFSKREQEELDREEGETA